MEESLTWKAEKKYVIVVPADQTIMFVSSRDCDTTTKHPEALLFDSAVEAFGILAKYNAGISHFYLDGTEITHRERFFGSVELVEDELEFLSREDTW